jgi:hypothetical protein
LASPVSGDTLFHRQRRIRVESSYGECEVKRFLCYFACLVLPALSHGQAREDEIVANLASGRVIIDVAHDGMVVGTVGQPFEAGSIPPRFVDVGGTHIAVLLGAAEWAHPGASSKPARIERDVERVIAESGGRAPSNPETASDIELIGIAYLEHLRPFAGQLHHKIALGPEEPILEIVVAGYAPDYGPEVWLLKYRIRQEMLRSDYYQTRVLRPAYTQLYPPEKHAPRTLVEVRYPEEESADKSAVAKEPLLLSLIQSNDSRFVRLRSSDLKTARVIEQVQNGKSQDSHLADAEEFMHAALVILAGDGKIALGAMSDEGGFKWVVPPAETLEKSEEETNRPPGAPTLRRKP